MLQIVIHYINFNIHSIFKIVRYQDKTEEAPNLSATNGRSMILVLELVIKLISLNIHLISKITPYVHKTKEAIDLSATKWQ